MPREQFVTMDEQVTKQLLQVLMAVKKGDVKDRLPEDWTGINGKIADNLNGIIELNQRINLE